MFQITIRSQVLQYLLGFCFYFYLRYFYICLIDKRKKQTIFNGFLFIKKKLLE